MIRPTATQLTAEQVAVYPILATGLTTDTAQDGPDFTPPIPQDNDERAFNQISMETIAKDTGGKAFYNSNNLDQAMAQAIELGSHYYTIAYTPENTRLDGKYRRIELKTSNHKLRLSYRRGYYAASANFISAAGMRVPYARCHRSGNCPGQSPMNAEFATAPRVSVIGLGNILLGDDGFGPCAVEIFRCKYECGPNVEILDVGTPGVDLAPYLYGRGLVVLLDALDAAHTPGTLCICRWNAIAPSQVKPRLTGHDQGVAEALTQLYMLDQAPHELVVIGAVPKSCEFNKGISSEVFRTACIAVDHIAGCCLIMACVVCGCWRRSAQISGGSMIPQRARVVLTSSLQGTPPHEGRCPVPNLWRIHYEI
jgi:hydrogenase maturation protease